MQQKGFLTYYFLDGDADWLRQMERYQQAFLEWLKKAKKSAYTEAMEEILEQIDTEYQGYIRARQEVIRL